MITIFSLIFDLKNLELNIWNAKPTNVKKMTTQLKHEDGGGGANTNYPTYLFISIIIIILLISSCVGKI